MLLQHLFFVVQSWFSLLWVGKEGCDLLNRWLLEGALVMSGLWIIRLRS